MGFSVRVLVPVFLLLAGCDAVSEEEPRRGTFEAQVSGAYDATLDGTAAFAPAETDEGRRFLIQLAQGAEADPFVVVSIYRGTDVRPGPGTYAIVPPSELSDAPDRFVADYTVSGERLWMFERFPATTGTLTIEASSDSQVRGTVTFSAADAGRSLQFQATFRAIPGH